jgi:hypothetical protein
VLATPALDRLSIRWKADGQLSQQQLAEAMDVFLRWRS